MTATDQLQLDAASELEDLSHEIALVRLQIVEALGEPGPDDDDRESLRACMHVLVKLMATQHRISGRAGQNLAQNLAGLIEDLGVLVDSA
jgi:hypothetical protein